MKAVAFLVLAAASVSAFVAPKHMPSSLVAQTTSDSLVALEACRRNTKKEKRQRNQENMRKFKRGAAPAQRGARDRPAVREQYHLWAEAHLASHE